VFLWIADWTVKCYLDELRCFLSEGALAIPQNKPKAKRRFRLSAKTMEKEHARFWRTCLISYLRLSDDGWSAFRKNCAFMWTGDTRDLVGFWTKRCVREVSTRSSYPGGPRCKSHCGSWLSSLMFCWISSVSPGYAGILAYFKINHDACFHILYRLLLTNHPIIWRGILRATIVVR
jgi:hypothetical protein